MDVLTKSQAQQVQAGSLMVPGATAVGVGLCGGILAWAIKSAYRGDNDAFNHFENYLIEGGIGAGIAAVATLSFIMAAA